MALNNLWSYIQGMSLKKKDREWLAGKLLEPVDDAKTEQQKAFVKESLYRALDEVERAKREGRKLKTLDEFLDELEKETVRESGTVLGHAAGVEQAAKAGAGGAAERVDGRERGGANTSATAVE